MRDRRQLALALATAALVAAASLTATAAAGAQATANAAPSQAGKASLLHWAIDGGQAPINGQIPTSVTMAAPPGFGLNYKAVAERCRPLQAKLNECPTKSRIGSAVLTIHIDKPAGPRDLPLSIKLYLGPKNSLLAVGFLAGVRVVPGSISGSNGIAVTFNPLPTPPVIAQVSYRFLGLSLDLGTHRTVTQKVKSRTTGRRPAHKAKGKKTRIDLVSNAQQCSSGSWAFTATVGLPDGTRSVFDSPVACSAA